MATIKTRYTIHEHRARRAGLHYDLRLQQGNNVHSFALPKAKLPDENNIYMAVKTHVDYNNLDILKFSGSIPDGKYGAGNISVIETAKMEIIEWTTDSSKIIFFVPYQFGGQYLRGKYYLIKTSRENVYIFGKSKNSQIQSAV